MHVRHVADSVAALVFITQRRRAPVDAFTVLHGKMYTLHQNQYVYSKNFILKKDQGRKLTRSAGLYIPSALGTPCCRSTLQRCSSRELSSPPWRPCAVQLGSGRIDPNIQRPDGPNPEEAG
jgi:hypothetical protein